MHFERYAIISLCCLTNKSWSPTSCITTLKTSFCSNVLSLKKTSNPLKARHSSFTWCKNYHEAELKYQHTNFFIVQANVKILLFSINDPVQTDEIDVHANINDRKCWKKERFPIISPVSSSGPFQINFASRLLLKPYRSRSCNPL